MLAPPAEVDEANPILYRVYTVDLLPELMRCGPDGVLLIPVNTGTLCPSRQGSIVLAILLVIGGTIFGGLAGLAAGLVTGFSLIIVSLLFNIVFMGVGGAMSGLISGSS